MSNTGIEAEVRSLLSDRPDVRDDLIEILEIDTDSEHWDFDDISVSTGIFGELVSRGIVEKDEEQYRLSERNAVESVLYDDSELDDSDSDSDFAQIRDLGWGTPFTLITGLYLVIAVLLYLLTYRGQVFGRVGLWPVVKLFNVLRGMGFGLVVKYVGIVATLLYLGHLARRLTTTTDGTVIQRVRDSVTLQTDHGIVACVVMVALLVRLPILSDGFQTAPGSFYQPLVATEMLTDGLLKFEHGIPVGLDWTSPSGRIYFRGSPAILLQALSLAVLGFNDAALRIPGIVLGACLAGVVYLLGRRLANRTVGVTAGLLVAFSNWAIFTSSFIRHYVHYELAFVLSIYFFLRWRTQRSAMLTGLFFLSLAFLLISHVQAFIPVGILVAMAVFEWGPDIRDQLSETVDAIPRSGSRIFSDTEAVGTHSGWSENKERYLRYLGAFLISLYGLSILSGIPSSSRTLIIQLTGNHFALYMWILVSLFLFASSVYLLYDDEGTRLVVICYSIMLVIPILIGQIGRDLAPRYTTILSPILLLILSIGAHAALDQTFGQYVPENVTVSSTLLGKVPFSMGLAVFLVVASAFVFPGFQLPGEQYDRRDVNPSVYQNGQFVDRPHVEFKSGYSKVLESDKPSTEPVLIFTNDPWNAYWYTKINDKTSRENYIPVLLGDPDEWAGFDKWTMETDTPGHHMYDRSLADNYSRFARHSGIPVISSVDNLTRKLLKHERAYAVFTEFNPRSGALYRFSSSELQQIHDSEHYEVYEWNRTQQLGGEITGLNSSHRQIKVIEFDGRLSEKQSFVGNKREFAFVSLPERNDGRALRASIDGGGENAETLVSTEGLDTYPTAGDVIKTRIKLTKSTDHARFFFAAQSTANNPNGYHLVINAQTGSVQLLLREKGETVRRNSNDIYAPNIAGEWINVVIRWESGQVSAELRDVDGTPIAYVKLNETPYQSGGIGFRPYNPVENTTIYYQQIRIYR